MVLRSDTAVWRAFTHQSIVASEVKKKRRGELKKMWVDICIAKYGHG